MFSVPHLIIIFVVVLIVFGPEKLPDLARNLGKIIGEFRRATGDLRSTFDEHLRDIEREANMRAAATAGTGTTTPPAEQKAIGEAKIASAEGTVAASAPRAWRVTPARPTAGEKAAASATGTAGATQAEGASTNPADGGNTSVARDSAAGIGTGATQAGATTGVDGDSERAGESAKADQGKGSDGGSRPA